MIPRTLCGRRFQNYVLCGVISVFFITGCSRKKHDDDDAVPPVEITLTEKPMDEDTKSWWIQKANATLRLGQPIEDVASSEELQTLAPSDVVAKLTNDAAFYDMMADFASYWLGTKPDSIREVSPRQQLLSDSPREESKISVVSRALAYQFQVVNAVKTMAKGGDFWNGLFREMGPAYVNDIDSPYMTGQETGGHPKTPNEVRIAIRDKLAAEWSNDIQLLKGGKHDEFCAAWQRGTFYNLGGPRIMGSFGLQSALASFPLFFFVLDHCATGSDAFIDDAKILSQLTDMHSRLHATVEVLNRLDFETNYNRGHPRAVAHVTDLPELDLSEAGIAKIQPQYNSTLFFGIQNSSTNRNRRRAAWVLKRFFCDDLTPLNIEAPASHVGGQHGSDPACYSCHYKLDPMAGYFRELGNSGQSFAKDTKIIFDDGATAERSKYEKPWKADAATGREWNIGYIRSVTDDSQNSFGSDFADLLTLLRTAPEVKECFVRRAFEYAVGEEQAFDKTWARGVTSRMNQTAKIDPTLAIKQMFSEIITSQAYRARERNNNVCYDFDAGADTKNRAPCRIATLLERNCASCHNASNKQGNLDLTTWKVLGDGKPGFAHTRDGKDITAKETFLNMIDRINATDSAVRMPLLKSMPAPEREELFLWLQREVARK